MMPVELMSLQIEAMSSCNLKHVCVSVVLRRVSTKNTLGEKKSQGSDTIVANYTAHHLLDKEDSYSRHLLVSLEV